jgi:hypothetical protein
VRQIDEVNDNWPTTSQQAMLQQTMETSEVDFAASQSMILQVDEAFEGKFSTCRNVAASNLCSRFGLKV